MKPKRSQKAQCLEATWKGEKRLTDQPQEQFKTKGQNLQQHIAMIESSCQHLPSQSSQKATKAKQDPSPPSQEEDQQTKDASTPKETCQFLGLTSKMDNRFQTDSRKLSIVYQLRL
jgi:hypothetical protein